MLTNIVCEDTLLYLIGCLVRPISRLSGDVSIRAFTLLLITAL